MPRPPKERSPRAYTRDLVMLNRLRGAILIDRGIEAGMRDKVLKEIDCLTHSVQVLSVSSPDSVRSVA